jgi:DNA-binding NtrC family response regulator
MSTADPAPSQDTSPPERAPASILVVEDRDSLRRLLCRALEQEGFRPEPVEDGARAIQRLSQTGYDLVLTDLKLPGASGLEVLAASRRCKPQPPVVVMTAFGTVSDAVEAMKLGAFDFLEKPVEVDTLLELVSAAVRPGQGVFEPPGGPAIVGSHPLLRTALRLLQRVAPTESTVLLTGESGTGKELFARALHQLSPRAAGPFVAVNCAALPAELMENELFGHEKGAFTGADRRQAGRFEVASKGTLFLDEVGELPLGVQAKVLRVLEDRTFERVGGSRTLTADVRLVAATNRPLAKMVEAGTFRADLYYRLEIFPIELPPLRRRPTDLAPLARHLLRGIAQRLGRPALRLSSRAEAALGTHDWPGNVRELANVLERTAIVAEGPRLDISDLEPFLADRRDAPEPAGDDEETALRRSLEEAQGDKQRAAELLGVSYRTVLRRVRQYDLEGYPKYRS